MRRRDFIKVVAGSAAAWPLAARAQQPAMPVIGFISSRSPDESASAVVAFRQGLAEAGYVEGQNVEISFRWAEGDYDRLPMMAADLARRQVTAILATASDIAPRAVEAGDKSHLDGITSYDEDDRNRGGCRFDSQHRRVAA